MQIKLKGYGSAPGISMGEVFIYNSNKNLPVEKFNIGDINAEIKRYEDAIIKARIEIENLYVKAELELGKEEAKIFHAHKLILDDPELNKRIKKEIKEEKINSEWVIKSIIQEYIEIFEHIEDEILKNRITDIKDVLNRVIRVLLNIDSNSLININKEVILVSNDITPSDAMHLEKNNILAIAIENGSIASHASIIAKTLGIPAVIGVEGLTENINDEDILIVDGFNGNIIINPDTEALDEYYEKKKKIIRNKELFNNYFDKETKTLDNKKFKILGNIATIADSKRVVKNGGEGIGLVRTEVLYMNRTKPPTINEQVNIYKNICKNLAGKPVTIRTLDIGGDKVISYLPMKKEKNPFLGYRGIRFCLGTEFLFKDQIKAIYITSASENVRIMYPMVTTMKELESIEKIENEVKEELDRENIPYDRNIKKGIMIETPSAAIQSDDFAKKVDFFSIGTNDLIQYIMAIDRENQSLKDLYSYYHPAVLRIIKIIITNAKNNNIEVAMCGEMASTPELIPILALMGLDEFSVAPSFVLQTRYIINNINLENINDKLDYVLSMDKACEIKEYLNSLYKENIDI